MASPVTVQRDGLTVIAGPIKESGHFYPFRTVGACADFFEQAPALYEALELLVGDADVRAIFSETKLKEFEGILARARGEHAA